MAAAEQDEPMVKCLLDDQERMENERAFYEPTFRDIDRYIDPFGAGGFNSKSPGNRDVEDLFDITAIEGADRCTAAIAGITIPRNQRWHGVGFQNKDLDKLANVRRWSEIAQDRLFVCRYVPAANFGSQAHEDIRQEIKYGTAPLWVDERRGVSLFYKALHLSEVVIDENYAGLIDRKHRRFKQSLRQCVAQFGIDNLSDKLRAAWEDEKKHKQEVEIVHVIRPNDDYLKGQLGYTGKPVESIYFEVDAKWIIRRGGYYSDPMPVSRHITGPRDKYGRSPAMKVLATVKGLNSMARDLLEAGNMALRPPILFYDDADITSIKMKPSGMNPGGLDEMGREMVKPFQTQANIPFGKDLTEMERAVVDKAFLGEIFRLLSDPSDRMTATQVIETLQKEGVLIAPFAERRETEKLAPMVARELDILMRAGEIPPFPQEVLEAGALPTVIMTNPLARMARAEEVGAFTRWVEIGVQAVSAGIEDALDRVNFDEGMKDVGEVLGVRPSVIRSDEEVAAIRQGREQDKAASQAAEVAPPVAGAALSLAKANQLSEQMAGGGGMG